MSRGLGKRQLLFLQALRTLEAQDGIGDFYVWAVVEAAWPTLGPEHNTKKQARAEAWAAYKAAEEQDRAVVKAKAALGDPDAMQEEQRYSMMDSIETTLRFGSHRKEHRGAPTLRPGEREVDHMVNPSRIIASLAERGLVERKIKHGPGATVRLTEAGRA